MIPAKKSALFSRWFAWHAERRLHASFATIRVRGLAALRDALAAGPVLVVSNHTSWWDPLVLLKLCLRDLRADAYAMMDADNLRRLPFFARVGAFGVDLGDRADGARSIRYAARLLDAPGRLVWLFPQGREVPVTARRLSFRRGSGEIARVARRARVVPVGLRYEHGARPEPDLWIAVGSGGDAGAVLRDAAGETARHEELVATELARIDEALVGGVADGFERLHEKRPGRLFAFAQAVLAWLAR